MKNILARTSLCTLPQGRRRQGAAPRPAPKSLLPQEIIGCAALIDPSLAVPKKWPDITCLERKKDGAVFLVPEPQPASDWDECTSSELTLTSLAKPCQ